MAYNTKEKRKAYDTNYTQTLKSKWTRLKQKARDRNITVALTFEEYCKIVEENRCRYCGNSLPRTGYGIDRQDNREGYSLKNCVACCQSCNTRKGYLELAGCPYPYILQVLRTILCLG